MLVLVAGALPFGNSAGSQAAPKEQGVPSQGAAVTAESITLAAAVRFARERSFTGRQYDARVAGAAARLTGAGKLMNPVASVVGHFGKNAAGTDEDYILSQSFELGDKRRQRVRAAAAERDAATFDRT